MPAVRELAGEPGKPDEPSKPDSPGAASFSALRIVAFLALFMLLSMAWASLAGPALHQWVIEHMTVAPAAQLLGWLDPQLGVSAQGNRLQAEGGGLRVSGGCEGVDMALLLISGALCAAVGWRARMLGLVLGSALVFALNQARILGLFYAFRHNRELFDLLHTVLMPLAMVLVIGGFFIVWLGAVSRAAPSRAPANAKPA